MEKEISKKSNKKLFVIFGAIAAVVIGVVVALILILSGNKKSLIGKWVYEGGSWYYNFISETEGRYGAEIEGLEIPEQEFTYQNNGDSFHIQYKGMTASMDLEYRIEGDKLIIVDSLGKDTVYVRK